MVVCFLFFFFMSLIYREAHSLETACSGAGERDVHVTNL